jgi:hypothetical protein
MFCFALSPLGQRALVSFRSFAFEILFQLPWNGMAGTTVISPPFKFLAAMDICRRHSVDGVNYECSLGWVYSQHGW